MNTTITNPETGQPLTRLNVMRVFTYDVEALIQQFRDDNRMSSDEELEITYDEIMDYVTDLALDDFRTQRGMDGLIITDQDGNEHTETNFRIWTTPTTTSKVRVWKQAHSSPKQ